MAERLDFRCVLVRLWRRASQDDIGVECLGGHEIGLLRCPRDCSAHIEPSSMVVCLRCSQYLFMGIGERDGSAIQQRAANGRVSRASGSSVTLDELKWHTCD